MITGVILAGGRATRMGGGDKAMLPLGGKPLLWHVIERLIPQVDAGVLNANGDPVRFFGFGLPVVADADPDFAGPLAGILAGMRWAQTEKPQSTHIVTVASDTPFFPENLAERLMSEGISIAASATGPHWVFGSFPIALAFDLEKIIASGSRKVADWVARHPHRLVEFEATDIDPFFNINTPADLEQAEAHWTAIHS